MSDGELLWRPSTERLSHAGITRFTDWVNREFGQDLADYDDLWRWSIADIGGFWAALAQHYDVLQPGDYEVAVAEAAMPGARWFTGCRLNFAEYLLRQGAANTVAVYAESEAVGARTLTWGELREQVATLATHLRARGVQPGDHVCAYLPISCEAVVALLATTAIGAVWSSCSPDFGSQSTIERFSQVQPKALFAVRAYRYGGKLHDRTREVGALLAALGSLETAIELPWADPGTGDALPVPEHCTFTRWAEALRQPVNYDRFEFARVPFDHALWVLYTSGTTGPPKGIVHGHGGILLEFVKTGHLHDDLDVHSVKFFFTTTGWTMFNLLVGGLVTGAAILVYDGNPAWPGSERLFELASQYGVTYFGASPTYVNGLIARDYRPAPELALDSVRTIALTGSPASEETFRWFYRNLHPDLHVMSMSGGTDVAAPFVGGVPTLPVYAGAIQAPCLGVDACAFDEAGRPVVGEDGELVIRQPMPSMPLYLIDDPDNARYIRGYFEMYPGTWRQGDLVRFGADGSCVISGRSDSTLNRYGIRLGTSEIYRNVDAIDGIADSLIVNLELSGARFYMPLFVVLEDERELDDALVDAIEVALSQHCSPRHVPDEIFAVAEIPYTLSGKKMEVPVKRILGGTPLSSAFKPDACRNPAALEYFAHFADRHAAA